MESSERDDAASEAKQDEEHLEAKRPTECLNKPQLQQNVEVGGSSSSSCVVLDWYEESRSTVSRDPPLRSAEEALAALTICDKDSDACLDLKKEKEPKGNRCFAAEEKVGRSSVLKEFEDESEQKRTIENNEKLSRRILKASTVKTIPATEERVRRPVSQNRTTQIVEKGLWKEEWFSKGIKAFEISCKNSTCSPYRVKDILRLPGLLLVDIDKDTFIASYRSVEKGK